MGIGYRTLIALCIITSLLGTGVPTLSAADEYDISTDRDVDVPSRTVTQGGDTFTITTVARADPGETVSATVDAPSGDNVNLFLLNSNQAIVTALSGTGTTTFDITLNESDFSAGTYAFVVQHNGTRKAIQPLVVRGYSVSVDPPTEAVVGDNVTVTADIDKLRGENKDSVEIVLANDDTSLRATAKQTDDDEYEATINTQAVSSGSYDAYANVRGGSRVLGEKELLGLSGPTSVQLTDPPTPTPTDDDEIGAVPADDSTDTPATSTPTETPSSRSAAQTVTQPIVDESPEEAGVTVNIDIQTLDSVTFDETAVQLAGDMTVRRLSETPSSIIQQFSTQQVFTTVDISTPPAADSQARLQFELNQATLNERPATALRVVRVIDNGIQVLSTETRQSGDQVIVTAETPGFSTFAVVALDESSTASDTEQTATDTPQSSPDPTSNSADMSATAASSSSKDMTETSTTPVSTPTHLPQSLAVVAILAAIIGRSIYSE